MNTKAQETEEVNSIYDMFGTNSDMEKHGMILNYGKVGKIRVARAGGSNSAFAKALEAKTRPYRRQIDAGIMDEKEANQLLMEAFAETVVLGWEDIRDREGKLIKFSKDAAVNLFTDLPDLFVSVREESARMANFQMLTIEGDSGN